MDEGIYSGELNKKNGMKNGTGKCVYADGSIYEGSWYNNLREGIGVMSGF